MLGHLLHRTKNHFPFRTADLTLARSSSGSSAAQSFAASRQSAGPQKRDYEYEYDYANGSDDSKEQYSQPAPVAIAEKKGYSAGSGLRSIAQGSADQASSAVNSQHAAGKQAAYVAKNQLAQAASQAAATAQAALAGKQVLLQGLEQQNIDAHQALDGEIQQLQQAKRSAKAAQQSAQQAMNHLAILTAALNNAQTSSEHAQQAAGEAAAELASQTAMVGAAKQRVEAIDEQLHAARIDFEATQQLAQKAASSAQQAQNVAAEAAAHAAIGLHESTQHVHHGGGGGGGGGDYSHEAVAELAANHNYGDFSPSLQQYSFAGY